MGWVLIAHPYQPLDSGAQGPGARPKALSCRQPHLGWFLVGVRRLEEARATGLACRDAYSRLLTLWSLRSPGGPGVRSSSLRLVGRLYNGRVVALCCVPGYGRRRAWRTTVSPTHGTPFPFRPVHAWLFGVGRLACGLFIVGSFSLQQFGWYMVVLAALRPACSLWGLSRCSPRRRSQMLSLLSSRLVLRFVAAGLSDVAVIAFRPGCARRVVFVRRCFSCQWSACLGLCGAPYRLDRPRLVAVGRPLCCLFPVGCVMLWLVHLWRVRV